MPETCTAANIYPVRTYSIGGLVFAALASVVIIGSTAGARAADCPRALPATGALLAEQDDAADNQPARQQTVRFEKIDDLNVHRVLTMTMTGGDVAVARFRMLHGIVVMSNEVTVGSRSLNKIENQWDGDTMGRLERFDLRRAGDSLEAVGTSTRTSPGNAPTVLPFRMSLKVVGVEQVNVGACSYPTMVIEYTYGDLSRNNDIHQRINYAPDLRLSLRVDRTNLKPDGLKSTSTIRITSLQREP